MSRTRIIHRKFVKHTRLAAAILKSMKRHDWILADVSKATKVSSAHLSRILANGVHPNSRTLAKLAKGLKVKAATLLEE